MQSASNSAFKSATRGLSFLERLNFLVTNRIPRHALTIFIGKFSRIENVLVRSISMTLWTLCVDDLRLFEAEKQRFDSLHDCFVRKLKPGARPVDDDAHVICSPCDAIIGEFGKLEGIEAIQAKGFPYAISELLGSEERARRYRNGRFITLRLKSSMYHRFHAPCDAHVTEIDYISGDTWNVNPVALKVVNRLFCKNERAVIDLDIGDPQYAVAIVAVAAILVASIRIHGIDVPLNLAYKGPNRIDCDLALKKGDEIGYFEHGSTILLFTTAKFRFVDNLATGRTIRMGQALLQKT